jgi:hypothetical protein
MGSQKQYPYITGILNCSGVSLSVQNVITTLEREALPRQAKPLNPGNMILWIYWNVPKKNGS